MESNQIRNRNDAALKSFSRQQKTAPVRMQLGRVLEMAESSPDKRSYEAKIVERFGGQQELELVFPPPVEKKETAPDPYKPLH